MTDFISQKKALDELSSLYQKEVSEKATPESGTGKYYNEKKPTSQQLEKREKMNKVKALTNAGKHQEASKLYKSTMKKEDVSNWRDDLREIVGTGGLGGDVEDTQSAKPNSEVIVKEKNVKNKVVIDPEVKLEQALGGKVVELKTVSEKMTTAALEDSPSDCPDCGEPVHEGACATAEEKNTVEEEILWDRVAESLTRLSEMNDVQFRVVPLELVDEIDEKYESAAEANRKYDRARKAAARRAAERNRQRDAGERNDGRREKESYRSASGTEMHYKGYKVK